MIFFFTQKRTVDLLLEGDNRWKSSVQRYFSVIVQVNSVPSYELKYARFFCLSLLGTRRGARSNFPSLRVRTEGSTYSIIFGN